MNKTFYLNLNHNTCSKNVFLFNCRIFVSIFSIVAALTEHLHVEIERLKAVLISNEKGNEKSPKSRDDNM